MSDGLCVKDDEKNALYVFYNKEHDVISFAITDRYSQATHWFDATKLNLNKIIKYVNTVTKGVDNMPWPHKHRPRKGRRKIGSAKRKARRNNKKKKG